MSDEETETRSVDSRSEGSLRNFIVEDDEEADGLSQDSTSDLGEGHILSEPAYVIDPEGRRRSTRHRTSAQHYIQSFWDDHERQMYLDDVDVDALEEHSSEDDVSPEEGSDNDDEDGDYLPSSLRNPSDREEGELVESDEGTECDEEEDEDDDDDDDGGSTSGTDEEEVVSPCEAGTTLTQANPEPGVPGGPDGEPDDIIGLITPPDVIPAGGDVDAPKPKRRRVGQAER